MKRELAGERGRERERDVCVYIYIYMYISTHVGFGANLLIVSRQWNSRTQQSAGFSVWRMKHNMKHAVFFGFIQELVLEPMSPF